MYPGCDDRLSRTQRGSGALWDGRDPEQGLLRPEAVGLQDLGAELDPMRPSAAQAPDRAHFPPGSLSSLFYQEVPCQKVILTEISLLPPNPEAYHLGKEPTVTQGLDLGPPGASWWVVVQGLGFRPSGRESQICHTHQMRDTLWAAHPKRDMLTVSPLQSCREAE